MPQEELSKGEGPGIANVCVSPFHPHSSTCVSHWRRRKPRPGGEVACRGLPRVDVRFCSSQAPHSATRPASATSPDGGDGLTVLANPVCRPRGRARPAPRPERSAPPVCSTDRDLGALAARARGSGLPGYKPPSRATGPQGLSVAVALVLRVTYSFDAWWSPKGLGSGSPRGVRRGL